ncbi:strawberry notch-like NTP hydrolase domain-containing protein [Phaeobacter piscinae]|uniref:strawberry notch-like NTP hydrolase domain-containing protein n=1 Tax=Phaeobacter piscinae TaxID=1580596 RepID=UPI0009E4F697|nr:strawberry notch family protein [Phaeobacter piscinae]UTS82785.1 hypothetical protein OL67_003895 [Phaeobacter piscinae]
MRLFVPRSGEGPVGLIVPSDRYDGSHEALAIVVPNSEKRSQSGRIRQVARHNGTVVAGSVSSNSHTMVVVALPSDTEGFFEALGIPGRVIRRPENQINLADKATVTKLFDRDAPRYGFEGDAITPRLIGQNLSGKDVFQRLLGRTFADAKTVHAEWQNHQDGETKRAGGRGSLFLYGDNANDWRLIARTAVATASKYGRVSQAEIDELLAVGAAGDGESPTAGEFRELIEGEMATVISKGFVSGREAASQLSTGLPPFAERDGVKLTLAQFSTPPAVGQLAAEFLQPGGKTILEPTVGNGVLAAAVASAGGHVTGFELFKPRAARAAAALGSNSSVKAADFDEGLKATHPKEFDGALINPPFGKLASGIKVPLGYGTAEFSVNTLDAEVTVKSLARVKRGGDAVLVMPADMFDPAKLDGGRLKQQILFNRMFSEVRSVALNANLYKSMGANTPVLVHFLSGKMDTLLDLDKAVEAAADEVQVVGSYDELYEWADDNLSLMPVKLDTGPDIAPPAPVDTTEPVEAPADPQGPRDTASAPSEPERRPDAPVEPSEPVPAPVRPETPAETPQEAADGAEEVEDTGIEVADWYDDDIEDDAFTRPYVPFSAVGQGSVVIQKTLQGPVYRALKSVQDEVGDLDDFVSDQLGVDRQALMSGEILSPEQVDSIALGLYRRTKGEAMIIGDKMGVGKGRQLAALALSAIRNDQPVLFSTLDPTLFTDFASRDLRDVSGRSIDKWISDGEIRPFIFNPNPDAGLRNPETGETIFHTSASERGVAKKVSRIDPDHNLVMLTYSQLQTQSGHWRLQSILNWLDDNAGKKPLVQLDEVHKAAGVDSRTGVWVQAIIDKAEAVGGDVVYSSATSMKSGKNIVVYSAALPNTGIATSDLMKLMEANPLSMQEVLSAEMASGGRLIEREMSSAGIEREMVQLADLNERKMLYAREATDLAADFLAELVDIAPTLKDLAQTIAKAKFGGAILNGQDKTVDVTTTSPVSQFDNYSRYLMLAVKGLFAEELMMKSISKGEKPTLVVDSTADTLTEWVRSQSNSLDDQVDGHPNIGHVLKRNASRLLDARIETAMGDSETIRLSEFEGWYSEFCERVDEFDWSGMRINVLDLIAEVCDENGLTFRDITKRSLSVVERDGRFYVERRDPVTKAEAIREFGAGRTDVLGLNKGAATGLSAHASPAVGPDLRRRSMIPLQFQKDITDQRQVEGRINRFAQKSAPIYYTPSTGFAADERLANLFNRANRNLTSSTSASRENATNIEGIDLLNPVGDMAVAAFAKNNPEIADRMDLDPKGSDLGRKLLGRIVCLPLDRQEAVLAEVDTIFSLYMEKLTREGRNPLRLAQFDWNAEVETVSVLVDGREDATALAEQPVYLNRAAYVEHVRWETTKEVSERVASNAERAGDRSDPEAYLGLDRIYRKDGVGYGFNFAHDVFKEARHGGSAAGEEFRNLDPLLLRHLHDAWRRAENLAKNDEDRTRREVASDLFLDKMKFELDRTPDGETGKAWNNIRDIEAKSGRAFNPARYMVPISRAVERAELFSSMRDLLKPGRVVGIRPDAISDFMQGEFGKALKAVGDDDGVIPAVITAVRFPKDEVGTPSNWHVSFVAAGSQGYFGSSLSSMMSGLDFSGTHKESDRPIVPIEAFVNWMGRSSKSSDVLAKVYGERWNGVVREIAEAAQELRTEGVKPDVTNPLGYRLFSTVNDHVPSGTRLRERFVLEGNLFAALQLVQSGKKAEGEKAVFTDSAGVNRHAVVLSENNTEEILDKLASKSQNNAVIAPELSDVRKMQAYLEIIGVVHAFGSDYSVSADQREDLLKTFADAMYELDREGWASVSARFDESPDAVVFEVAQSLGNVAEDLPLSIAAGGDPWRWFYDVGTRGGRSQANEQRELYPATTEVIERGAYGDDWNNKRYVLSYNVDKGSLKLGLEGLSQTGMVAASVERGTMTVFFKKTNPAVKDDPDFSGLVGESTDHLGDMKLPRGVLSRTYYLDEQQDVVGLADILSSIAKYHQNELLLNGGGKRIYKGLQKLQDNPVTEQSAEINAGRPDITAQERTLVSSPGM